MNLTHYIYLTLIAFNLWRQSIHKAIADNAIQKAMAVPSVINAPTAWAKHTARANYHFRRVSNYAMKITRLRGELQQHQINNFRAPPPDVSENMYR